MWINFDRKSRLVIVHGQKVSKTNYWRYKKAFVYFFDIVREQIVLGQVEIFTNYHSLFFNIGIWHRIFSTVQGISTEFSSGLFFEVEGSTHLSNPKHPHGGRRVFFGKQIAMRTPTFD